MKKRLILGMGLILVSGLVNADEQFVEKRYTNKPDCENNKVPMFVAPKITKEGMPEDSHWICVKVNANRWKLDTKSEK